jgi:hypothetical protein
MVSTTDGLREATQPYEPVEAVSMRLMTNRRQHRHKAPKISISQAEITADLLYPASRRPDRVGRAIEARGRRR